MATKKRRESSSVLLDKLTFYCQSLESMRNGPINASSLEEYKVLMTKIRLLLEIIDESIPSSRKTGEELIEKAEEFIPMLTSQDDDPFYLFVNPPEPQNLEEVFEQMDRRASFSRR